MKQKTEAINHYETALRLRPDYPEAYNNLAVLLTDMDEPDAAIEYCRKGLALEPASAALVANMATALQNLGLADEAVAAARKSVELRPEGVGEHSNLLYKLNFNPAYDAAGDLPRAPGMGQAPRRAAHGAGRAARTNDRTPDAALADRLCLALFSRPRRQFLHRAMIVAHDHEQFEIFCYTDVAIADAATARLRAAVDQWRDVRQQSDEQLAEIVRARRGSTSWST